MKTILQPSVLAGVSSVLTVLATIINVLFIKKHQHIDKVMTAYEGGVTVDEIMAVVEFMFLLILFIMVGLAFFAKEILIAIIILVFSAMLLILLVTTIHLESCYVYVDGIYYEVIKKIKGYVVVQKKNEHALERELENSRKLRSRINEVWVSSKGIKKVYKIIKVLLVSPTRASLDCIIKVTTQKM
ncbi:hypothetical protein NJN40_04330 [Lacticaseibacillus paracasei]|uniref:hypothetical protein n=1 Tax=Lacticaseibacillus paracasei TaxID=1597 RepID=UPI002169D30E|nr:hypothetical protein [Lacticaseibacillus paracasei]UVH24500.1 hypothetical protein NJN40_04330 [Lacticaseibacillus paracasei]